MPLPVGVSVAMMKAVEGVMALGERRAQQRGAQVAGGADLQRHVAFDDDPLEILVGHGGRPAVHVERHVRLHREQMIAGDRAGARDRRAAGVAGGDHAMRAWRRRRAARIRNAVLKAPKPAFASHTPFFAISPRSLPVSAGSRMTEPAIDLHAAGPVVLEALAAPRPRAPSPLRRRAAGREHGLPTR